MLNPDMSCFKNRVDPDQLLLRTGTKVIELFSCSTKLSTKFQLLLKTKIPTKTFLALNLSNVVFIMLINVKMPTIVGIITFMSRINSVLSRVKHENFMLNSTEHEISTALKN